MARNRKTHHSTDNLDPQITDGQVEEYNGDTLNTGGQPKGPEASTTPEGENTISVPSDVAQEIWESLREEFYEQIEQLPLSLHRSFALIGEQDREVQACQAELLPTIRSYVKLRQSLQVDAGTPAYEFDSQSNRLVLTPGSLGLNPDMSEAIAARQSKKFPERTELRHPQKNFHKEEDLDVSKEHVFSRLPYSTRCGTATDFRSHNSQSPTKSSSNAKSESSPLNAPSQSAATRPHGLRETDATVPKSVPFPPRPKPKTTRELLALISFLTREQLRASEEKVGLATAAYDSVDRHVRALDATIGQYQDAAVLGPGDSEHCDEKTMHEGNDAAVHEGEGEDDEEPQLGMIGPLAESAGRGGPRLRRNRKRDRRNQQQKHLAIMHPLTHVRALSAATPQELPVDPHEPRYCYCNQVSYGEMIACDNTECTREWFHLGCAGLAAPPKGKVKWYCRDCEEMLGSNRRRRIR